MRKYRFITYDAGNCEIRIDEGKSEDILEMLEYLRHLLEEDDELDEVRKITIEEIFI